MDKKPKLTHEQMDKQNWRYKKSTPPVDESNGMNGPVKTTKLPDPFKCSKCGFIGTTKRDFNEHWELEH